METKTRTIDIWISINKNGFINMSIDEPNKNIELGKWIYNQSFINIDVYNQVVNLVEHSKMTWESEPEFLTLQVAQLS